MYIIVVGYIDGHVFSWSLESEEALQNNRLESWNVFIDLSLACCAAYPSLNAGERH